MAIFLVFICLCPFLVSVCYTKLNTVHLMLTIVCSVFLHVCRYSVQGEKLQKEKQLVKDIAEFLLLSQIPGFVSVVILSKCDCLTV